MSRLANTEEQLQGQEAFATAAQGLFNVARSMLGTASPSRVGQLVQRARKLLEIIEQNRIHLPED